MSSGRPISFAPRSILDQLKSLGNESNISGMARYGIRPARPLGISMKNLRAIASSLPRSHNLALRLWASGIHEARILATIIDEPARVDGAQMDRWIREVDSWDLCDQCCANLFEKTPHAWSKCVEWSRSKREFMKRGGFSLMARLAVVEKTAPNDNFVRLLTHIGRGAADDRNLVKKAVSWALRQIGKRNFVLHRRAKTVARKLTRSGSPHARWVGKDVLRELQDPKVLARLAEKKSRESGR